MHRLKEELCEAQEKQKDLEEQLKVRESELQSEQLAKLEMAQRLLGGEEERAVLTQERDGLKQQRDSLQTEIETLEKPLEEATCKVSRKELQFPFFEAHLVGKVGKAGTMALYCPLKLSNGDPQVWLAGTAVLPYLTHHHP